MVSTAAFHARVRGSVPHLGGLNETKMFLPHPRVKLSTVESLRDREVACSASDRQGSNFESCVWRTVSSHSSHHPQEVLLARFSLYVHKGDLKPDSFHFYLNSSWWWLYSAGFLAAVKTCYVRVWYVWPGRALTGRCFSSLLTVVMCSHPISCRRHWPLYGDLTGNGSQVWRLKPWESYSWYLGEASWIYLKTT